MDCVKNILHWTWSLGHQSDCRACICHIIPQFCRKTKSQKNLAQRTELVKHAESNQCGPDQTPCPSVGSSGCCPEANWFCCVDGHYCAATAADCPNVAERVSLLEMAKQPSQCGSDQTLCPNGCCPHANWFCCPDGPGPWRCAVDAAHCQNVAKADSLVEMVKPRQTWCPPFGQCQWSMP